MKEFLAHAEHAEKKIFATAILLAKIITITTVLALLGITEFALVKKVYHLEFQEPHAPPELQSTSDKLK